MMGPWAGAACGAAGGRGRLLRRAGWSAAGQKTGQRQGGRGAARGAASAATASWPGTVGISPARAEA